jgi:hypothetical protein
VDLCQPLGGIATAIATVRKKTLSASAPAGYGDVMDSARVTYAPRADATPEGELAALAAVYAFILECHAKKKAAEASGGEDDGKGDKRVPATSSIP